MRLPLFLFAVLCLFIGLIMWRSELAASVPPPLASSPEPTFSRLVMVGATSSPTTFATTYLVTKIVDGDTIAIAKDGKTVTIRLMGIDTPETVDPRTTVQCFGKEASDKTKALL